METLSSVMNTLRARGYTIDFNSGKDKEHLCAHPENYKIDKSYRFEGMTNPEDEAVLYSISSTDGKKGLLVNGYGIYSDSTLNELIKKIHE